MCQGVKLENAKFNPVFQTSITLTPLLSNGSVLSWRQPLIIVDSHLHHRGQQIRQLYVTDNRKSEPYFENHKLWRNHVHEHWSETKKKKRQNDQEFFFYLRGLSEAAVRVCNMKLHGRRWNRRSALCLSTEQLKGKFTRNDLQINVNEISGVQNIDLLHYMLYFFYY